ncbi:hypothetical protein GLOIN_2v1477501 [Rhizophagus irregularis DAOM 181602=DAOM 197198]|nr:hypothetical protein GLOIN_2v1477501 [Rhizophagus irregularis DAOM 181602=DAOM 197198]
MSTLNMITKEMGRNFLKSDQRRPAMTLIEFVNDIKKCKVQRNILSTQIEGISNELASSKIQDQMNDIEALNEKESDKVRLNQELNDLIPYKKFAIPYSNNLWPSFGSAWNQISIFI